MMNSKYCMTSVLFLACLALAGCPELEPRFNVTGEYAGDFKVGLAGLEVVDGCGIQLTLDQDISGLPILNARVDGSVTLSFICVVPDELAGLGAGNAAGPIAGSFGALLAENTLGAVSGLLTVPNVAVTGVLLPDGTLELNTPGIIEECAEEDCVKLAMLGKGLDADGDGNMERLSGTFAGTLGTSLGQIPIIGDIDVFLQE